MKDIKEDNIMELSKLVGVDKLKLGELEEKIEELGRKILEYKEIAKGLNKVYEQEDVERIKNQGIEEKKVLEEVNNLFPELSKIVMEVNLANIEQDAILDIEEGVSKKQVIRSILIKKLNHLSSESCNWNIAYLSGYLYNNLQRGDIIKEEHISMLEHLKKLAEINMKLEFYISGLEQIGYDGGEIQKRTEEESEKYIIDKLDEIVQADVLSLKLLVRELKSQIMYEEIVDTIPGGENWDKYTDTLKEIWIMLTTKLSDNLADSEDCLYDMYGTLDEVKAKLRSIK